jgi:hypothetical protein
LELVVWQVSGMSGSSDETVTGGWEDWWREWVVWIVKNPWDFLYYLFLCLSPLFVISMISSWKLSKSYQAQANKDKKRAAKKSAGSANKARTSRTLRSNANKTD